MYLRPTSARPSAVSVLARVLNRAVLRSAVVRHQSRRTIFDAATTVTWTLQRGIVWLCTIGCCWKNEVVITGWETRANYG